MGIQYKFGREQSYLKNNIISEMEAYKAISSWADDLGQKARELFGCRKRNAYYSVPSRTTIKETLFVAHSMHVIHNVV